jgi:hypothetical protein
MMWMAEICHHNYEVEVKYEPLFNTLVPNEIFFLSTCIFSSSELKAQMSFSDHLFACRLSVRLSVCKLFTFSTSSPEPLGQF